ncbi:acyl carrier protein [Streptomyces hirsutus]|uniref:Acyl carrier protein n=1 Tax=Streptomyces hirsutus TaxID=35620 RepID=A0ABZ1GMS5_9ACTN|nr:acyl carrier protein [Streptomyces hirsutus]WSD06454.1 acyl carrier protein [Streptomyces hirsutus]WTD20136.1 acyl carrier protein [Streptomyces hirsutus]WTD74946.1 acyl carrier protein [Streptomyces sp. NBC_01635]
MNTTDMTLDDVKRVLAQAVAAEAGVPAADLATDQPFTSYGLDSMAALAVGMEIEDACGLSDLPVDLLWDHPTVDSLSEALWNLMNTVPVPATADGRR